MCEYEGETDKYIVCNITGAILIADCDIESCSLRKRQTEMIESQTKVRVIWRGHIDKTIQVFAGKTTYAKACKSAGITHLLTVTVDNDMKSIYNKVQKNDREIVACVNDEAVEADRRLADMHIRFGPKRGRRRCYA